MNDTLPKTLKDIIECICCNNTYKGFRVYAENGRTNVVINFVNSSMLPHEQPSKTEDISNLKAAQSPRKRRSPANLARDTQRVKVHKEDLFTPDSGINNASCLTSLNDQFMPGCSTPSDKYDKCDGKLSQLDSTDLDGHCAGCEVSCYSETVEQESMDTASLDESKLSPVDNNMNATDFESDHVLLNKNDSETPDWAKLLLQDVNLYVNQMKAACGDMKLDKKSMSGELSTLGDVT